MGASTVLLCALALLPQGGQNQRALILAPAGDFDVDGHADFVVTRQRPSATQRPGPFVVVSGLDGSVLKDLSSTFGDRQINSFDSPQSASERVLLARTSSPKDPAGRVELWSLKEGRALRSWSAEALGASGIGGFLCPDWNGDGRSDVTLTIGNGSVVSVESGQWKPSSIVSLADCAINGLVCVPDSSNRGTAFALFTLDNSLDSSCPAAGVLLVPDCKPVLMDQLRSLLRFGDQFNGSMCVLEQRDEGDDRSILCALGVRNRHSLEFGEVLIIQITASRSQPSLSLRKRIQRNEFSFGTSLACVGDIDGDGHNDVVVGASGMRRTRAAAGGSDVGVIGGVMAISVESDRDLYSIPGIGWTDGASLSILRLGDMDDDGIDEYAVNWPASSVGEAAVEIRAGKDGSIRYSVQVSENLAEIKHGGRKH